MNDKDKANSQDMLSRASSELTKQMGFMEKADKLSDRYKLFLEIYDQLLKTKQLDLTIKLRKELDIIKSELSELMKAVNTYNDRYNKIKRTYKILFNKEIV
jgi:DNA repair exonuclease SbcCD ATPase subunit